jgi:hypothetical protein
MISAPPHHEEGVAGSGFLLVVRVFHIEFSGRLGDLEREREWEGKRK